MLTKETGFIRYFLKWLKFVTNELIWHVNGLKHIAVEKMNLVSFSVMNF